MYARPGGLATSDLVDVFAATNAHRVRLGDSGMENRTQVGVKRSTIEKATGTPIGPDEDLAALYAGEITYMDKHIGRLLDGLAARDILDDALVIITSDHGETFWEHGDFWNHGLWVYDTTVKIVLIFRVPGDEGRGLVVGTPTSNVDILPTVLDLLGLECPPRMEGASLLPALRGDEIERGPVFSEATQPWQQPKRDIKWPNAANPRCVRRGSLKYIHAPYAAGLQEMYDVANDPAERDNLIRSKPTVVEKEWQNLRLILEDWSDGANPLPSRVNTAQGEEVRRRLESLGYIGGSKKQE
jgi:arylsulfatase A-like enzyme